MEFDLKKIDAIIDSCGCEAKNLITVLQGVQAELRYLPTEVMEYIAEKMDISVAKVFSVATFYENFSLNAKGQYVIKICDGTACHVRKSIPILTKVREILGLSEDKPTTDDMMFTVETVSCLGACGLAPVMTVNDKVFPSMTPEKAETLINDIKEGKEVC
ncbi:MAG: NAD(P)H-dependent oxidoreductase subunit E [Eubacteriales Family XIII. Incertae Sedis bacterium]|nr:MAG: NAD(P)H-dependent oxidoreductase subunit E [Clostridiales Family XIII bacterium]